MDNRIKIAIQMVRGYDALLAALQDDVRHEQSAAIIQEIARIKGARRHMIEQIGRLACEV